MKFTDIEISGFGIWSNLELRELSPQVTVFYGPNEAGKTTILQFVRGALYGFTPARRQRYLPSVHGSTGGGLLRACDNQVRFSLERFLDATTGADQVTVNSADGNTTGELYLQGLLSDVDETTYLNIFAVGLSELQELSTLTEVDAGRALYDLAGGLDRVSLNEVLRELHSSRTRLLSADGAKSQIADLSAQRELLQTEIHHLEGATARYWRLSQESKSAEQAIVAAEVDQQQFSEQLRKHEAVAGIRGAWLQRASVEQQLAEIGPLGDFPPDALVRMAELTTGIRQAKLRRAKTKARRQDLRAQRSKLEINEPLLRQAPRIAAISEHESWIVALEQQIAESEIEVGKLEHQLAAERTQTGLPKALFGNFETLTNRVLATLRAPAAGVRDSRLRLKQVQQELSQQENKLGERVTEVEEALLSRGETELAAALEKQGQLVSQLRRRLQLDDRLDQMGSHRADLKREIDELVERQILPLWQLSLLGVLFVIGAGLFLAGLILPATITGNWGWPMVILGLMAASGAAAGKLGLEKSAATRLEACRKQLQMLERQYQQAKAEREKLDETLPAGGGSLTSRLHAAEADLAMLEQLLSLDARRVTAAQETQTTQQRAELAEADWKKARRRWQLALTALKLPTELKPSQIKTMISQAAGLATIEKQLEQARQERDRRRRELAALAARIDQLWADAGWDRPNAISATTVASASGTAIGAVTRMTLVEQLRKLRRELGLQEQQMARRDELDQQLAVLRRRFAKYGRRGRNYQRKRRGLLVAAKVTNEDEFRQLAGRRTQLDELVRRRNALSREIAVVAQTVGGDAELNSLLSSSAGNSAGQSLIAGGSGHETQRNELVAQHVKLSEQIKRLAEQRGEINHQLGMLADDRRLGKLQLELGIVEQRLDDALLRWQTVATTEHLLHSIKDEYERERQPVVLQEASEYLLRMTEGQYRRVWTPLGEDTLRVEDRDGNNLPIEVLSRGTREQLFLSLRMAMISLFARQGKQLPIVLDDVLVNFDTRRAEAAAQAFVDFAAAGHQLLIFTCHEHIARMFRALRADVRRLPHNHDALAKILLPAEMEQQGEAVVEPPRRKKKISKTLPAVNTEPEIVPVGQIDHEPILSETVTIEPSALITSIEETPLVELPEPMPSRVIEVIKREPLPAINGHNTAEVLTNVADAEIAAEHPSPLATQRPPRKRRSDPPHRFQPIRQVLRSRWSAEEFEGELQDQVKVNTQLSVTAWSEAVDRDVSNERDDA